MIAENVDELPEKIQQFYDYVDDGCKIKSYTRLSNSQIMLMNKAGQEAIFYLNLLEPYGHIDNEGTLWMGVHTWRFPSLEVAPLFLERDGEIVVIAPCEIPDGMIVGESVRVEAV
ncbi:MAG: hypothetical protein PHG06_00540 [Parabacteroides sp.]|nr:hypothetical protein [Parabacteroides sp.]